MARRKGSKKSKYGLSNKQKLVMLVVTLIFIGGTVAVIKIYMDDTPCSSSDNFGNTKPDKLSESCKKCIVDKCKDNQTKFRKVKNINDKINEAIEYSKCACEKCNCHKGLCKDSKLSKSKMVEKFKKNPSKYVKLLKPLL
jgi:hypothetical protein